LISICRSLPWTLPFNILFLSSVRCPVLKMFKRKRDPEAQVAHGAKGNSYNFMVVFFAALGSFTYGFSSSIIGTVFGLQPFFDYFNLSLTGPNAKHGNDIIGGNHPERHV